MLHNILELLSAIPKEIMDAAEKELNRIGYQTTRDPEDLFLFAVPPQFKDLSAIPGTVPMLVAHVDVVGVVTPKPEDLIQSKSGNKISLDKKSESSVLGADDRAGVYALFKIVGSLYNGLPFVTLTDKEEVGGLGARAIVDSNLLDDYKDQISCYIELDRKGNGEMVSYDYAGSPNEKLGAMFLDQGFTSGYGSYSDVADFTAATNTSNVNLSVGYHNEHTKTEVLFLDELDMTISRVLRIWKEHDSLFTEVFDQEEGDGLFDDRWMDEPSMHFDPMMDEVYKLSVSASESENVFELVQKFVDDLPSKLLKELVMNLEEVVDELSYNSFETDQYISECLVDILTSCEEEEEEEEELGGDFGMYVDQRGMVVCGKKNRVGCY